MQADVILKEPPQWVPPFSLSGGTRRGGAGGAAPPSYAPVQLEYRLQSMYNHMVGRTASVIPSIPYSRITKHFLLFVSTIVIV